MDYVCIWWKWEVDRRQVESRVVCHLWKKHSWRDPISQPQDHYWREENQFFVQKFLKSYIESIFMQNSNYAVIITEQPGWTFTLLWCWHHKKLKKMRIGFWILCLEVSVIFRNRAISTRKICVFVQVGILIHIQNKKWSLTFMYELKQENKGTDVYRRISLIPE